MKILNSPPYTKLEKDVTQYVVEGDLNCYLTKVLKGLSDVHGQQLIFQSHFLQQSFKSWI